MNSSDTPFTDSLLEAGDSILAKVLKHPVILSLADIDLYPPGIKQLLKEELITARNNFYIQDYFYLAYGYKLSETILLD